jgi:hypothetical protein
MRQFILSALAAITLSTTPALACTCGCDKERLLQSTPYFFVGKPLAVKQAEGKLRYEIEVVSAIRGTLPPRVIVSSPAGGGACRVSYDLGKPILIGARGDADELQTNLCVHLCVGQNRDAIEALKPR